MYISISMELIVLFSSEEMLFLLCIFDSFIFDELCDKIYGNLEKS